MENPTLRKFKWFWAWQDEKEEQWLGEMSRQGWHLRSFELPGWYSFTAGMPQNYVYRLDFQTSPQKDREQYLQLFNDAGWEYLGQMSAWQYFRKLAEPGENPEIFTDVESKVNKYQRILGFLVIFLPIWVVLFPRVSERDLSIFGIILMVLMLGILTLYIYASINLIRRIQQLRKLL